MIVPASVYRRIGDIDRRLGRVGKLLPHRVVLEAGLMEPWLKHIPEDERREVVRLLEKSFDDGGMLVPDRLTTSERRYMHGRITEATARS